MTKVMVTGVNGFVGHHLARELKSRGFQIVGVGMQPKPASDLADVIDEYCSADLTSAEQVAKLPLNGLAGVISLAGLANSGKSFGDPEGYRRVNVDVLKVLGGRLLKMGSRARVIAVSTGAVYDPRQSMPLTETSKLTDSGSPYAQSKILMEQAAGQLKAGGLDCVIVRPFNHIGPGQEAGFLVPDLYKKIKQAQKNGQPLMVGNLKTKRDYTDVRDVVRAYADLCLANRLNYEVFNVCSEKSFSGQEILNLLGAAININGLKTEVDQSLIRPDDPPNLYGDHSHLSQAVGWKPKIELDVTIRDFVRAQLEK